MISGRSTLHHNSAAQKEPMLPDGFVRSLLKKHAAWIGNANAATLLGCNKSFHFMARLLTPGELSPRLALMTGILIMAIIAAANLKTPPEIRLHILYLFPLAAIALHCERLMAALFGLSISFTLLSWNLLQQGIHDNTLMTDALVTAASSVLTVSLARAFRANYLETINLATTDWLTGLHNRRSFQITAENEISRQQRYGGVFSLAMIDLDGFKSLNDTKGHQAGDTALGLVAEILRTHTRRTDVIARLGGDEFAVLMPNTGLEACLRLTRQLVVVIAHRMARAGFGVTASIGSSSFAEPPASVAAALQSADTAMYAAKARGKGCAVVG